MRDDLSASEGGGPSEPRVSVRRCMISTLRMSEHRLRKQPELNEKTRGRGKEKGRERAREEGRLGTQLDTLLVSETALRNTVVERAFAVPVILPGPALQ